MEDIKNKPFLKLKASFIALFAALIMCAGIALVQAPEKAYAADAEKYIADITIKGYGTVTVELDRSAAPITVDNFVSLARSGFYNGLTFHRIERNFRIQGGDPNGNGTGGSGTNIKGEFAENGWNNPISHERGVISMARSSDFNSGSSQFFFTVNDQRASLDGKYAAFGRVTNGIEVLDTINNYALYYQIGWYSKPVIESIDISPVVPGDGWVKSGKRWWYKYNAAQQQATGKPYPKNETVSINGKKYSFDSKGWMRTNWQKLSGNWYYFGSDGSMKYGWQKVKGTWYYMASNGVMQTGKQSIGGKTYFLKSSGAMKTGWNLENNKWYYYDPSGVMKAGTLTWVKNGHYLFEFDGSMQTGMKKVNEDTYYFDGSGKMRSGWVKDSGKWYLFNYYGIMVKGWAKVGSTWYYLNSSDGVMMTGLQEIDGKQYYLTSSGAMKKGWQKIGSSWYYFGNSGAMAKNAWVNGEYWVGEDGVMATNAWVDGGRYYVNSTGKWVKGAVPANAAPAAETPLSDEVPVEEALADEVPVDAA